MKKIKKAYLLVVLSLVISSIFAGCSHEPKNEAKKQTESEAIIKVATTGNYYPFTYIENDELVGFDIDVWNEIGKRINKKVEWEITSFDGMFGMLDSGKVDSATCQIAVSEEKAEKYNFSEVYAYSPYKICVSESNDDINSLEDLYGKSMSLPASCSTMEFLDKVDPEQKIERKVYDFGGGGDIYKDTELGRVVAISHSLVNFDAAIEQGGYKLKLVGDVLFEEENAFPFAKNNENNELIEQVNNAIREMHEDGTLTQFSEKWFSFDVTVKDNFN